MARSWKIILGMAAAAVVILGGVRPAEAHGIEILRSDPLDGAVLASAPAAAQAWFSEELAVAGSTMQVYDASGSQVDLKNGGVDLNDATHTSMKVGLPALGDGVYVVRWQAMLPDGDSVLGTFQFTVSAAGYPAAAPAPAAGNPGASSAYPAGSTADPAGGLAGRLASVFENRDSLVGAAIGGLAVLLGILVLIRKLTAGKD